MPLYSKQFDDIYFNPDDGWAETAHVFLAGNNLPDAWQGKKHFIVSELGFGSGLNFLATWQLFDQTSDGHLTFCSVEKYPLSRDDIQQALLDIPQLEKKYLDGFLDHYKLIVPGLQILPVSDHVTLVLFIGDVVDALAASDHKTDAWFLDGFKPSSNPDMWSENVFAQIERLSKRGTSFATFTAAGTVKRGLEQVGFDVSKQRGYGRKRDMLIGVVI